MFYTLSKLLLDVDFTLAPPPRNPLSSPNFPPPYTPLFYPLPPPHPPNHAHHNHSSNMNAFFYTILIYHS
jgi:hypothetical protein